MSSFKTKENIDAIISPQILTSPGANANPQSGFIMMYAGPIYSTTATGTSGSKTITVASATGAYVGQGIYGTAPGVGINYITAVSGTTITLGIALTQSISASGVVFCPYGWTLCDGTNFTPDLRGYYIAGYTASYPIETTLGSANHTHTFTSVVNSDAQPMDNLGHTHASTANFSAVGDHSHTWSGSRNGSIGNDNIANYVAGSQANISDDNHIHSDNSMAATVNDSTTANHTHAATATSGAAQTGVTHSHTTTLSSAAPTISTAANTYSTFYVNFIRKV